MQVAGVLSQHGAVVGIYNYDVDKHRLCIELVESNSDG